MRSGGKAHQGVGKDTDSDGIERQGDAQEKQGRQTQRKSTYGRCNAMKKEQGTQIELVGGELVEQPPAKYSMTDAALEQRRKAARIHQENTERMTMIRYVAEISKTADINDPESLLDCFHQYLQVAQEQGVMIGNLTAYAAMGINRDIAYRWEKGERKDERYKQLILYVKRICAAYRESLGLEGKIHPALTIFWQRNFDGLTNEDMTMVDMEDPLGKAKSRQEIQQKYADMPED